MRLRADRVWGSFSFFQKNSMPPSPKKPADKKKAAKPATKSVAKKAAAKPAAAVSSAPAPTRQMVLGGVLLSGVAVALSVGALAVSLMGWHKGSGAGVDEAVERGIYAFLERQNAQAAQQQREAAEANAPREVDFEVSADDDPFLGSADAPVTIVEFSDFECPFCRRHALTVHPELMSRYVETGQVRIVYRDLPLPQLGHARAIPTAIAAECVRQQSGDEAYFAFHDAVFAGNDFSDEALLAYAGEALPELDAEAFAGCRASDEALAEVEADVADAQQYGVNGTPTFFINNVRVPGAYPLETFVEIIDAQLAAAGA